MRSFATLLLAAQLLAARADASTDERVPAVDAAIGRFHAALLDARSPAAARGILVLAAAHGFPPSRIVASATEDELGRVTLDPAVAGKLQDMASATPCVEPPALDAGLPTGRGTRAILLDADTSGQLLALAADPSACELARRRAVELLRLDVPDRGIAAVENLALDAAAPDSVRHAALVELASRAGLLHRELAGRVVGAATGSSPDARVEKDLLHLAHLLYHGWNGPTPAIDDLLLSRRDGLPLEDLVAMAQPLADRDRGLPSTADLEARLVEMATSSATDRGARVIAFGRLADAWADGRAAELFTRIASGGADGELQRSLQAILDHPRSLPAAESARARVTPPVGLTVSP